MTKFLPPPGTLLEAKRLVYVMCQVDSSNKVYWRGFSSVEECVANKNNILKGEVVMFMKELCFKLSTDDLSGERYYGWEVLHRTNLVGINIVFNKVPDKKSFDKMFSICRNQ